MSSNRPLVSVIVPTRNSQEFLAACLQSIKEQTYPNIELIVVDNNSSDDTKEIARKFTSNVHNIGPERSAQRNYGVRKSKGDYVLIIDSDMVLSVKVVEQCIEKIYHSPQIQAIIIPEESFGVGFWARCKRLERSFYVGVEWMEAARLFARSAYLAAGGYREEMVSGEDWDLSQRVAATGKIGRIDAKIQHDEGELSIRKTLRKKFYYSQAISDYLSSNHPETKQQANVLVRYKMFFSQPSKLFQNPVVGVGMLFMKTCEFAAGALGLGWKNFVSIFQKRAKI